MILQASCLALWLSEKDLSVNSKFFSNYVIWFGWEFGLKSSSINRAGADSPLGGPKLTFRGRLFTKENIKSNKLQGSCKLQFLQLYSKFTSTVGTEIRLLAEDSHLGSTFLTIQGTCEPPEPRLYDLWGLCNPQLGLCIRPSNSLLKARISLLKAWLLFQDRGYKLLGCGSDLVCT